MRSASVNVAACTRMQREPATAGIAWPAYPGVIAPGWDVVGQRPGCVVDDKRISWENRGVWVGR